MNPIHLIKKYFLYWRGAGSLLLEAFGSYKRYLVTLIILGIVASGLEALSVNILVPLFSFLGGEKSATTDPISRFIISFFEYFNVPFTLLSVLILICILFIGKAIVLFIFGYLKDKIRNEYQRTMTDYLFSRTLSAQWPYLLKQKQGYLETVLTVDVVINAGTIETISFIIIATTSLLTYSLVAINISQAVTGMTITFLIVGFIIFKPLLTLARKTSQKSADLQKNAIHHVSESLSGIKLIKMMKVEKSVAHIGSILFKEYEIFQNKIAILQQLSATSIKPLSVIFISFILLFSYYYTSYNLGALIAIVYLVQQMFGHIQNLQSWLSALNTRAPYIHSVLDYKRNTLQAQEDDNTLQGKPFIFSDKISFDNITFSYNQPKKIIKNVSFTIQKGSIVGFVGESGAGKTTVFDLITRLFEPESGAIYIDETNIKDIKLNELRGALSYVSQDMFLLSASIADNVRFFDNSITNEQIRDAAKRANILDFVEELPNKFETFVGEKGVLLSVGQRQRILIARALARNPQILLLDEATSALDNESELYIKDTITKLRGKTTVLVIAHRLSTLSDVDKLFFLEGGKIIEDKDPEAFIKNQ